MKQIFVYIYIIIVSGTRVFSQSASVEGAGDISNTIFAETIRSTLTGKITDAKTSAPLPGASIFFPDLKLGAYADNNGRYRLDQVPEGHHLAEVSHIGYTSIIEHIDIESNTEKDFALQPSFIENQGVIVTGVSNATNTRKSPVPVTALRRPELLQSASTSIIDALAKKPGVSQLTTEPGISKPVIRGLGYNRVLVINEGVRQEGQQWGDEHGIEIDELSISRAEILKGPASLVYGSDALAGVVNLVTNVPVPEGIIRGSFLSNYQTNNNLVGLHANVAGNKKGISWNAYGSFKSAGNYSNRYDGRVLNSSFNEKNTGGYIGINKKWGFSHLIFSSFNQELGLVEGDRDETTGKFIVYAATPLERIATREDLRERIPLIPRQQIRHYKIASDNNLAFGRGRLKMNLGFQNNQRKEFTNPEDENEAELFFDMNTFTYNLQYVLPEVKEWHITVGGNGMYQASKNKAADVLIPEYDLFDIGGFVYAQRYFEKLTLSSGARFDHRSLDSKEFFDGTDLKFAAFKTSYSNFSGSVGISYEPADYLTLKTNLARGFRAPNIAELGSGGVHEGTFRYEYGNRDLKSETSLQWDAGFELHYEHFNLGISGFYNRISNFIFYHKLESVMGGDSVVHVGGEDITAFRFGQDDATLSGMEVLLDIHPHPLHWLHFENSLSFVRGRFDHRLDGTDNLPLIPAPRLLSKLRADFKNRGKSLRNFYISLEMDRNFIQNKPFFAYNTETTTAGYSLLNAGIGTDIINKKTRTIFSIHFAALNLTDAAYQNHLGRLKYAAENPVTGRRGIFNMGRNFSLKLNIPLYFSEQKQHGME